MGAGGFFKGLVDGIKEELRLNQEYYDSFKHDDQEEREVLTTSQKLSICQSIEEDMCRYRLLPYQICNCSFIDKQSAFAMFNLNNKQVLQIAIDEINSYMKDCMSFPSAVKGILLCPPNIPFEKIVYDYRKNAVPGDKPMTYIIYQPKTKQGANSKYPLKVHFSTFYDFSYNEFWGDLFYSVDGQVSKAVIYYYTERLTFVFRFGVIGRTFLIKDIDFTNTSTGKKGKIYDVSWDFEE